MKKRLLWVSLASALALAGGWFLSPSLRAGAYDFILRHGPSSSGSWAVKKLEGCGDPGLAAIVDALGRRADRGVVALAIAALPQHPRGPVGIAAGLADPDPFIRLHSAEALQLWISARGADLEAELGGDSERSSARPQRSLSEADRARLAPALPALLKVLEDPEDLVRARAFAVAADLGEAFREARPLVLAGLTDRDTVVRQEARRCLSFPRAELTSALERFLAELVDDLEARPDRPPPPAPPQTPSLKEASTLSRTIFLESEDDPRPAAAAWLLWRLQARSLPDAKLLLRMTRLSDPKLKRAVANSLLTRGEADLAPLLEGPASREAAEALIRLSKKGKAVSAETLTKAREALKRDGQEPPR